MSHPTKYWHKLDNGKVQCDVCPRACKLNEGQRGLCFVRSRENNTIVLNSYGRSSGFCLDPIEKKPLNHFYPGMPVLSFGTAGCNLACKFCQNWDISKSREIETISEAASPSQLAYIAKNSGCIGIAFTYNDPVVFLEYAIDTAIECHKQGIKAIAVTAGYICDEPRKEFFQHIDAVNVDLKAFTQDFYYKLTGSNLSNVLDTLIYIHTSTNAWLEITTLLIPGENDDENEIKQQCRWIYDNLGPDVPLHFSAFHPDWKMKDHPPTPTKTLTDARKIAIECGLNYVYTGNVHDLEGGRTYCSNCNNVLIQRDWYNILSYNLSTNGCCNKCNHPCPGVFSSTNGVWGNKRVPISIA